MECQIALCAVHMDSDHGLPQLCPLDQLGRFGPYCTIERRSSHNPAWVFSHAAVAARQWSRTDHLLALLLHLQGAPSAQLLPDYPTKDKQQQHSQSHAAAVGQAVGCQPAEQQTCLAHNNTQNGQAEPMEAEKQAPAHAASSRPHIVLASSGHAGSFSDGEQQLQRFSSSSSSLGVHSRQASLLSESGRASRRTSLMQSDSLTDSAVPPVLQQVGGIGGLVVRPSLFICLLAQH